MSTPFDVRSWAKQAGIQTTGGFAVIAECVTLDELERFAAIAISEYEERKSKQQQPPLPLEQLGSEWVACIKLPVTVHVRNQRKGERHISTREGITPIKPDDLIMRGISGEEYPIGREIFNKTYRFLGEGEA